MSQTKRYFHYTTVNRLNEIIESGHIKLATKSIGGRKEKPVAWVSTNEHWEATATKSVQDETGNMIQLTYEDHLKMFGCTRIEVEEKDLMTWAKLRHKANMYPEFADAMEETGVELGGNPLEWYGSLTPISIDTWIRAEVFMEGGWTEYVVFE